jgi:hypothetical protein
MEATEDDFYYNQVKFLLYSFRKYAGRLRNSFFYICVNDGGLSKSKVKFLEDNFSPLKIVQKECNINFRENPSLERKYNLYDHFDMVDGFDRFVFVDCDIMIGGDFLDILLQMSDTEFAASSCSGAYVEDYEFVVKKYYGITEDDISEIKNMWNPLPKYATQNVLPLFNTGFFVMDSFGFLKIKKCIFHYLKRCYEMVKSSKMQTEEWNFEQTALSLVVMKEMHKFKVLDFTWDGPEIYHNFTGMYGKLHYLNPTHPDIVEKYSKVRKKPMGNKRHIYKIISEFHGEFGV